MGSYCSLVRQYAKSQLGKTRIGKCSTVPGKDRLSVAHFTVHSFYRRAHLSGLWDSILTHLVKLTRQKADSHRLYWLLNVTLKKICAWLSRLLCLRSMQIFRFERRDKQETKAALLASLIKTLEDRENFFLA